MSNRKIITNLSVQNLDKAIAKLEQYKQNIEYRTNLLRERVAQRLEELCQQGFDNSVVDYVLGEGVRKAEVTVNHTSEGNTTVVIAHGEDAIWVEFGAGVFYNGAVGQSPNPNGGRMGYTIGSYGKGRGKQEMWAFTGEDGERHWSMGTPASMPMWSAMRTIYDEIYEIAREVFR